MWHASPKNLSDTGRPLLLYTLTSADAFPYTVNPIRSKYDQTIVRGKAAPWAHHDPRPCLMPPDWSGGYSSLFAIQQEEQWNEEQLEAVHQQHEEMRGATRQVPARSAD